MRPAHRHPGSSLKLLTSQIYFAEFGGPGRPARSRYGAASQTASVKPTGAGEVADHPVPSAPVPWFEERRRADESANTGRSHEAVVQGGGGAVDLLRLPVETAA